MIFNHEEYQSFRLVIRTFDGGSPRLSDRAGFLIHVKNVNEHPVIEDTTRQIPENSPTNKKKQSDNYRHFLKRTIKKTTMKKMIEYENKNKEDDDKEDDDKDDN